MIEVAGSLGAQLGAALRAERFLRSTSQRALARELGVSKSFIGRLESGDLRGSAAAVARLVESLGLAIAIVVPDDDLGAAMVDDSDEARRLAESWRRAPDHDGADPGSAGDAGFGSTQAAADSEGAGPEEGVRFEEGVRSAAGSAFGLPTPPPEDPSPEGPPPGRPSWLVSSRGSQEELVVPGQDPASGRGRRVVVGIPAAWRSLRTDRFYQDPGLQTVAESWVRRAEAEQVRDAAGRRMPAHMLCFPIQLPRTWWYCRHVGWRWERRPIWSWRRDALWRGEAAATGANPPPLGAHPYGGCPMQGWPSEATRGDWPPDPTLWPRGGRLRPDAATR